MHRPTGTAA